jgi:hypothetical protein
VIADYCAEEDEVLFNIPAEHDYLLLKLGGNNGFEESHDTSSTAEAGSGPLMENDFFEPPSEIVSESLTSVLETSSFQ